MPTIPPSELNYEPPKPLPTRPGSQDAFTKPSLEHGKTVPYKPPVHGCVGVLKDSRSLAN